jgi:hypothetical protein
MITLRPELFTLDSVEDVQTALQNAVKLEHSTIPPYLYAIFSLQPDPDPVDPKPNPNAEIQALISTVVAEEMAHMALACNVLNAIGGSPVIDCPKFVPTYPGPLPGGVDDQLVVPLAPFSIDLVKSVFMCIEEPEFTPVALVQTAGQTIGAFYEAILAQIEQAGPGIFTGNHALQVTGAPAVPEVIPVYDVDGARTAINTIVEQGEGTSTSPLDLEGQYAHYYRFGEIANGHQLVHVDDPPPGGKPYVYTGDPIPFDPNAVLPLKENPKRTDYADGSQARRICDGFNYTYTTLLKSLHSTFNGQPAGLGAAVGLMESMWEQALHLVQLESGDGKTRAGPTFEWQPVIR